MFDGEAISTFIIVFLAMIPLSILGIWKIIDIIMVGKVTLQEIFEQELENENGLIGASSKNLEKDGEYVSFLVKSRWDFFKLGYNKGIKQKYRIKRLEPPNFGNDC